jgi:2-methylcitrate dehydratase PrpD
MIDGVATTLAGSAEPAATIVANLVQDLGGVPIATVLGKGLQTPSVWAAYANGTMTHAFDYDDISWAMGGSPTAPLLAIILALGEQYHLVGKEALLAYAAGSEVEAKLGRCVNMVHYEKGWYLTATLWTFGATAATGKLLSLNRANERSHLSWYSCYRHEQGPSSGRRL